MPASEAQTERATEPVVQRPDDPGRLPHHALPRPARLEHQDVSRVRRGATDPRLGRLCGVYCKYLTLLHHCSPSLRVGR